MQVRATDLTDAHDLTCQIQSGTMGSMAERAKAVRLTRPAPVNTFISAEHRKRLEELAFALSKPGKRCSMGEVLERGIDLLEHALGESGDKTAEPLPVKDSR